MTNKKQFSLRSAIVVFVVIIVLYYPVSMLVGGEGMVKEAITGAITAVLGYLALLAVEKYYPEKK